MALKMLSGGNVLLIIAIHLHLCLIVVQSQTIGAKEGSNYSQAKLINNEFCSQRRTSDDRKFCLKVLTSPAKDYPSLLKIATDAAHKNAKKTLQYMNTMFLSKITNKTLKPVLKDCISMYEVAMNEFEAIEQKLGGNTFLLKSDARIALDEVRGCQSLVESKKISDQSIKNRNRIAADFGELVVDLARFS